MRIFVAVELPPELRDALASAAAQVLAGVREARLLQPGSLHVTLRFLGELEPARVEDALAGLREAAAGGRPGTAQMQGFGAFPSATHPRVVWAGVDDAERTVCDLEEAVSSRLDPRGFPREQRPFHPHVTVARFRHALRGARGRHLAAALAAPRDLGSFPVRAVALVESRLTPKGARYSVLESIPLCAPSLPHPSDDSTEVTPSDPGTGVPR